MDTKIIGIILLICAGLVFQYSYDDFIDSFFSPEVKLKSTIEKDITTTLAQESKEAKGNIHHVKFVYRSTDALNFLKKHPPQFHTKKDGSVWLEVEVLDLQDNETPGFITQISVFDLKSKNKISEFGQTYYYKDFDKDFKISLQEVAPSEKNAARQENKESINKDSMKDSSKEEVTTKTNQDSEIKKEVSKSTK